MKPCLTVVDVSLEQTKIPSVFSYVLRGNLQVSKWNLCNVLNSVKILGVDLDLMTFHVETE